jgi:hypothetical protein
MRPTMAVVVNGRTAVPAGGLVRATFVVPGTCDADRQYRIALADGGHSGTEPFPTATGWTRATTIHIEHWATKR